MFKRPFLVYKPLCDASYYENVHARCKVLLRGSRLLKSRSVQGTLSSTTILWQVARGHLLALADHRLTHRVVVEIEGPVDPCYPKSGNHLQEWCEPLAGALLEPAKTMLGMVHKRPCLETARLVRSPCGT